jgi:hypothetical protein
LKDLASRVLREDAEAISPQYLNDIEHDRRSPSSDRMVQQFADALGIDQSSRLSFAKSSSPQPMAISKIIWPCWSAPKPTGVWQLRCFSQALSNTSNIGAESSPSAPARERLGQSPDDVLIEDETGNFQFNGPVMEDQKQARDQLRAMWPKLERELMGINEQIESDPNNLSLRKRQKELTKIVSFVRDGVRKRNVRDTIRTMQSKSSKDWSVIPDLALPKSVESGNPNATETSSGGCRWSEVRQAAAAASCSRSSSWASSVVLAFALHQADDQILQEAVNVFRSHDPHMLPPSR